MHSILASLSALFKSSYLFNQSVPAKFKVSRPVLEDFVPPSSPQRWNIFSRGLPTGKASGGFPHILCIWVHLASCVGGPGENVLQSILIFHRITQTYTFLFYTYFYSPQKLTRIFYDTDALFALLLETKRFSTARKPGFVV